MYRIVGWDVGGRRGGAHVVYVERAHQQRVYLHAIPYLQYATHGVYVERVYRQASRGIGGAR